MRNAARQVAVLAPQFSLFFHLTTNVSESWRGVQGFGLLGSRCPIEAWEYALEAQPSALNPEPERII